MFCCFIGLEVGTVGEDNCGTSLEGRGTDSSLGLFEFDETSGGEEFASVVSGSDGDTEGTMG